MGKKPAKGNDDEEITFVVEKGSPADKMLQVLKHHQFDAEITAVEVKGGSPGRHQLVKVDGVICDKQAGSSFTVWAIVLPSGMAYLLSVQGPTETDIPLWPRLYELFLKGEIRAEKDAEKNEDP